MRQRESDGKPMQELVAHSYTAKNSGVKFNTPGVVRGPH